MLTPVLIYLVVGTIFVCGGLIASKFLAPYNPTAMKLTSYECGEEPLGSAWGKYNVRFYLMGLMFLIFEAEIVLLFPWALVFQDAELLQIYPNWGWLTFIEILIFIGILGLGLAYIWVKGDIDWKKPKVIPPVIETGVPLAEYEKLNEQLKNNTFKPNN